MNTSTKANWFVGGATLAMVLGVCMAAKFQGNAPQWDVNQEWEWKVEKQSLGNGAVWKMKDQGIPLTGNKGWEVISVQFVAQIQGGGVDGLFLVTERRPKNR